MLRAEYFDGSTTYYWSTEPLDYDGKIWEPRISKDFAIPRVFSHTDKTGSRKRTISLTLDNRDKFFNALVYDKDVTPLSPGMINQRLTLYYDDGANKTKKFVGRISEIGSFGLDVQITVAENLYSYMDDPYPDAQIAYDYYSDMGINESWNAIPIVFGQVERMKTMWIDKIYYRFMVCCGPIYRIDKIYFNKTVMYDADTSKNGYQASPTSINIKVRIFRGTGSGGSPEVVGGKTSLYPGMCYIEFYDEATGDPTAPMLVNNEIPEIFVDLKGIQNDTDTDAERNPAKILYKMYTNPASGYNGWGINIPAADVDFAAAITECTTRAYYIDGIISEKQTIGNWTDAILKCMAGRLEEDSNGVIHLYIDGAKSSVQAAFDETGETGYNVILGNWSEPPIEQQINRLRVFYDKNPETGKWDKKPDANSESPIGSPYLADSAHATRILRWNTGTLELPLVRDDITADKLAQLYFKRDIQQLKMISFDTEVDIPSTLDIDALITITSPKFGWVAKQFTITEITKSHKTTTIKAQEYSAAAYTYQSTVPPTSPSRTYYSAFDIPDAPASFTMNNNGTGLQADGTFKAFINLSATMPRMGSKLNWYYKCHTDPNWIYLGQTDQTSQTLQWNQNSGNYDFTTNATSVVGNSGPYGSCVTCCLTTDTLANDTPGLSATAVALGLRLTINFDETAAVNKDFNHFVLQQSQGSNIWTTVDSNLRAKSVVVPSQNYSALSCFRVFAVDNSGNCSATSSDTAANTALQVVGADITNQPIVGKTFQTANTVCAGYPGVVLDPTGLSGYSASKRTFFIDASTGNATFEGTVKALGGCIGAFTINTHLYTGSKTAYNDGNAGVHLGSDGIGLGAGVFTVSAAGAVTATSGTVGGFDMNAYCLTTGRLYSTYTCFCVIIDSNKDAINQKPPTIALQKTDTRYAYGITMNRITNDGSAHWYIPNSGGLFPTMRTDVCPSGVFFRAANNSTDADVACAFIDTATGQISTSGCITAGTCIVTGSYVTTSLGTGNYLCLSGHASGYTGGGAHIWLQNNAAQAYINNNEAGSVIYLRGRVIACCCLSAGTVVWANGNSDPYAGGLSLWDGVPSYYGIAMRYNQTASFGWVGGGEYNSIFFHSSSGNRGWIFADNYTPRASIRASDGAATFGYVLSCYSIEAGTSIYAATSVTANTCVVAHAGAYISGYDLYTTKQVRAAGWYAGPWAGQAMEMGVSGGIGHLLSYDRAGAYCCMCIGGSTINLLATGGSYNMILCTNRNHLYDTSIYNTLFFVNTIPSTTLSTGYLQATQLNFRSAYTGSGDFQFQDCSGNSKGTVYWDSNGFGLLDSSRSWALWTTTTYVCAYNHNIQSSCRIESVSAYGTLALNGTLPGYGAMCYPTLCSSTAIYLAACGYFTGYFENQNLCVFGCVWAAAHCVSSSRTLKCNFTRVGPMLPSILKMDLQAWQRINGDGKWGFGAMAEEFRDLFPWWGDGYGLPQLDQLALRGIQELDTRLTDELAAMRRCINDIEKRLPAAA